MARRSLSGLRAIITGCSSGIGRALAANLVQRGTNVIVTARRESRLQELIAESKDATGSMIAHAGDIASPQTQQDLLNLAASEWGGLDLLVNNAGIGSFGAFHEGDAQHFRQVIDVNLLAAAEFTRSAYPLLTQGRTPMVVFMGSVLGHFAVPLKAEYCASKFALRGLSEAIRMEFRPMGVDVLLVSPSTTDSEFFDQALEDKTNIDWKRFGAMPPDKVAEYAVRSIQKGRREIILTGGGKALTFLNRIAPGLAQRLLSKDAKNIT